MQKISSFSDYQIQYKKSIENPELFWNQIAESFIWKKKWSKTLQGDFNNVDIQWFVDGKLNITDNCLDRHVKTNPDKIAFIWEPNDPSEKNTSITYLELYQKVCQASNSLQSMEVKKGDVVCIYMPMIVEAVVAMLACARVGAIHSVIFAGFSASALADRINDASAKVIFTSDGSYRGNKTINLKSIVDEALDKTPSIKTCIVYKRTGENVNMKANRDIWWDNAIDQHSKEHQSIEVDSEDPLFILYTSGSTGKPKGVVHTTGGYMVYSEYSFRNVFQYEDHQIYWCTADVGWITGHTYQVYGPLLSGATSVIFEGVPTYPDASRFWQVIEKHKVNIFYTAPTAIRSLMALGNKFVETYKMTSLEVLGSVGEPINEEAWHWYNDHVGHNNCPIVDTWWQTETGGILISPLGKHTPLKPTFATLPLPGIQPVLVDNEGKILEGNDVEGNLCIKYPWPSIIRTTYGDHERCKQTYFSTYKGLYFTGDGCRRDADGYYRILGRVDDVMNISGHRIGTAEVENAINEDLFVIESAVVSYPHEIKGQGIYAFVICEKLPEFPDNVRKSILEMVTKIIGPIAKPDKIQFVRGLPKTRSGKIMRRILRKIAERDTSNLGDISTLLDPTIVEDIIKDSF